MYPIDANLTEVDEPERVEVVLVSPSYFSLLGVQPQLGRIFRYDEDDAPGIAEKVVLSDSLWRRRFGGRADAIGRKLRIDNDWYTVVGVMPPGFEHPGTLAARRHRHVGAVRVSRGTVCAARKIARQLSVERCDRACEGRRHARRSAANVSTHSASRSANEYPADYPARAGWRPRLVPLHDDVVGSARTPLVVILASVGVVLLIACANIAGLLLARSAGRYRELGIRRALGAGRVTHRGSAAHREHPARVCGGIAGLLLAVWTRDVILALAPRACRGSGRSPSMRGSGCSPPASLG